MTSIEAGESPIARPIALSAADRVTITLLRAIAGIRSTALQTPAIVAEIESFAALLSAAEAVLRELGWADDE